MPYEKRNYVLSCTYIKSIEYYIECNISICLGNFLHIFVKASVAKFMFCKSPCFQHILCAGITNFDNVLRNKLYEVELQMSQSILSLSLMSWGIMLHCKNFWWKYIKNENCKSSLCNKVQKTNVSRYFSIL